jgi:hypothetical protein
MSRLKPCADCGCERVLIIHAKVTIQAGHDDVSTMHLKPVCLPCLLEFLGLTEGLTKGQYDKRKAMKCVSEIALPKPAGEES